MLHEKKTPGGAQILKTRKAAQRWWDGAAELDATKRAENKGAHKLASALTHAVQLHRRAWMAGKRAHIFCARPLVPHCSEVWFQAQ